VNVPRDGAESSTQSSRPHDATSLSPAPSDTITSAEESVLDAEKLEVYHLALELHVLAAQLVPVQNRVLRDQLERASLSVVLNLAEGAGRRSVREKRRFYTIARGSATECAAAVDVLRLRRLAPQGACASARSLALRVVQMLTKLDAALR
jgi:four helix bundle protein